MSLKRKVTIHAAFENEHQAECLRAALEEVFERWEDMESRGINFREARLRIVPGWPSDEKVMSMTAIPNVPAVSNIVVEPEEYTAAGGKTQLYPGKVETFSPTVSGFGSTEAGIKSALEQIDAAIRASAEEQSRAQDRTSEGVKTYTAGQRNGLQFAFRIILAAVEGGRPPLAAP